MLSENVSENEMRKNTPKRSDLQTAKPPKRLGISREGVHERVQLSTLAHPKGRRGRIK
jgi:hypothetical protein